MTAFESICASRRHCSDCRSRPAWRATFGAPEVCPFAISGQPVDRESICRACPDFGSPRCCGCGEARKEPWRELASCRFGRWLPLSNG